jgi:hypothetical protein
MQAGFRLVRNHLLRAVNPNEKLARQTLDNRASFCYPRVLKFPALAQRPVFYCPIRRPFIQGCRQP